MIGGRLLLLLSFGFPPPRNGKGQIRVSGAWEERNAVSLSQREITVGTRSAESRRGASRVIGRSVLNF